MKIATWNVNGIRARGAQVEQWLDREQPDVLCLQEIKASRDQVPLTLAGRDDYWTCWHGAGGYSGVAILVRRGPDDGDCTAVHPEFDFEHRLASVTRGDLDDPAVHAIADLVSALDGSIPDPVRDFDSPFLMPIEGVHTIEGRGTVVSGRVERGVWQITPGVVTDVEVDEVFVVLSGRATIEIAGGPTLQVGPGDLCVLEAGARTVWHVHETLRKVFVVALPTEASPEPGASD